MFNGNFNDFNQQMRNAEKTQNRIMKFGLMMWVLWVVFCVSLIAVVGYVAVHFLSKVW
jgi:hypothetical protein